MNGKNPTWRLWAGIVVAVGAYIGLGYWLSGNGTVEEWMYRIGLTAAAILPLVFVAIYSWIGLRGPVAAAWWRSEIGTSLVIAALTLVPIAGPLAWVFWVDNGVLTSSWLAWIEVSGPCVSALAWLRLCWVWLRVSRSGRRPAARSPAARPTAHP